jgi:hypothetical protein
MTAHLTDQEISNWVLGTPDAHTLAHLRVCTECCAELQQLRQTLGEYGDATRHAAIRDEIACGRERAVIIEKLHQSAPLSFVHWGMAAVMVLLVVAVLLIFELPRNTQRAIATPPNTVQQQDTDDELLVQIQQDLQSNVPQALAPGLVLSTERNRLIAVNSSNSR